MFVILGRAGSFRDWFGKRSWTGIRSEFEAWEYLGLLVLGSGVQMDCVL